MHRLLRRPGVSIWCGGALLIAWQPENLSLDEAAGKGAQERVTQLLTSRPELPNLHNQQGRTPLLEAVLARQWPVATLLIEKGADVNALDAEGMTALASAVLEAALGCEEQPAVQRG